jgi:hypothetical protein
MMIELVQQNPIISFLIALVPIVGGTWKLMDILFIKPRDFRISVLEKNVDEIRKEIQKQESAPKQQQDTSESLTDQTLVNEEEKLKVLVEGTTLLNDIDLFYNSWKDKSLTELQRDQFEKNYVGKYVVWEANFSSVSEKNEGFLWVSLTSPTENFSLHVIAVFEAKHKEALLMINKDELVTISGNIDSFSISPLIRNCTVARKI